MASPSRHGRMLEERSPRKSVQSDPTSGHYISSSLKTLHSDDVCTSKTPSPPKILQNISPEKMFLINHLKWPLFPSRTTATHLINGAISRIINRDVDFCLEDSVLDEDSALIVARSVTLVEYWLIMDQLGSALPRAELRNGTLVFLQPEQVHDMVAASVGDLIKMSLTPRFFYCPGTANFETSFNATKSPDYSFAPRGRRGPGNPADKNFATMVVEVTNTELTTKLIRDKEIILSGKSRVQVLLSISLPQPDDPQIYQILFWERDHAGRQGRKFCRSFHIANVESLDNVLPENAGDFLTWPWIKFRRQLLFEGVPLWDQPLVGIRFLLNIRQIGDCIKTTVIYLAQECNLPPFPTPISETDSENEEVLLTDERDRSRQLSEPFTRFSYQCAICWENIVLPGLPDNWVPSKADWFEFHYVKGAIGRECLEKATMNMAYHVSERETLLKAGSVLESAYCPLCNIEIASKEMKLHKSIHRKIDQVDSNIDFVSGDLLPMEISRM